MQVRPLAPLPSDRTIDLVVENIRDAHSGTPIEYLKSFPLGITSSLRMNSAHAAHDALSEPSIQIYFNQSIDPATVTAENVRVEPAVAGLKRVPYRATLRLEGAFDPAGKYTVFLEPGLRGPVGVAPLCGKRRTPRGHVRPREIDFRDVLTVVAYDLDERFFVLAGELVSNRELHGVGSLQGLRLRKGVRNLRVSRSVCSRCIMQARRQPRPPHNAEL